MPHRTIERPNAVFPGFRGCCKNHADVVPRKMPKKRAALDCDEKLSIVVSQAGQA
jgi:hypothetical protein